MFRIAVFILLFSLSASCASYKEAREGLDRFLIDPPFRIFYTVKGENAVVEKSDLNTNGIPDYVEDTMTHLKLADFVFKNILGFREPLKSERYSGVEYIDVNILKLKEEKHLGEAIDAVMTYDRPNGAKDAKVLSLDLRPDLEGRSFTPIHELFHIYMNGYTMLKNKWLVEGLARVSQRAFGYYNLTNKGSPGLPKNKIEQERLYKKSYDAFFFWNELMYRLYGKSEIPYKEKIASARYIDGRYILDDFKMYGFEFLKPFLEELEKSDRLIEKGRGLKRGKWSVKEQLSEKNNDYIWLAIKNTILKHSDTRVRRDPNIRTVLTLD